MQIHERLVNDVMILDVKGPIDCNGGDALLEDKINCLAANGHRRIILNLAEVPRIDSTGLGVMVACYTSLARQHGRFRLVNVTGRVRELLVVTKLITVFEVFDSEADAVASFIRWAA